MNWGQGLLSFQTCEEEDPDSKACLKYSDIKTPGTVINEQLGRALGSGLTQLELADEFDEIVGALIGQLMEQVVTQVNGLRGA
jgi:hypothetical protein